MQNPKPLVTVVVRNYARPDNIKPILDGWRNQSADPATLLLVNATPGHLFDVAPAVRDQFDYSVDLPDFGAYTRYMVAPMIETPYTLFVDDDFTPYYGAIDNLVGAAKMLKDNFACLGEVGYHLPPSLAYDNRPMLRSSLPKRVDYVRRLFFYRTSDLAHLDSQRRALWPEGIPKVDYLFAQALIQKQTGLSSYVTPMAVNGIYRELPSEHHDDQTSTVVGLFPGTAKKLVERGWVPQSRFKACQGCR